MTRTGAARRRRRLGLLVVGALAAVVLVAVASAFRSEPKVGSALPARLGESKGRTFYVDGANGNDAAPGTLKRPWKSLNRALARVPLAGSRIVVREGTYVDTVVKNRQADPRNPITLEAFKGEKVTLTATSKTLDNGLHIVGTTGLRVRRFDVSAPTSNNGFRIENSHDIELFRNQIHDNGHMGILVVGTCGGDRGCNSNIQIWNNRFYNNGGYWAFQNPYWLKGDHSIYWGAVGAEGDRGANQSTAGGIIANNLFFNQPTGRQLQVGPQAHGLVVTNNTFIYSNGDSNRYAGTAIELFGESNSWTTRNILIVNNIIARANYWGVFGSGPPMVTNLVRNNLAWGNKFGDFNTAGSLFTLGGGNLTGVDPRFTDDSAPDLSLKPGSPAIGKADPAYAPIFDFRGLPRVAAPDLGAIEFRPPTKTK